MHALLLHRPGAAGQQCLGLHGCTKLLYSSAEVFTAAGMCCGVAGVFCVQCLQDGDSHYCVHCVLYRVQVVTSQQLIHATDMQCKPSRS